jgi:geranylgeranyl pyrophosphate synthase
VSADPTSLEQYLADLRRIVEDALVRVLSAHEGPSVVAEPVRYALLGPGKRMRPSLTLAVADTVGPGVHIPTAAARAMALPTACAVEMVHAYSLVHDDLPAMDDDALRRGRPTTHVVYGEGFAILAGDALLTEAFGVIAEWPSAASPDAAGNGPSAGRRLRAVSVLAAAAGVAGMVGGQALDLAATGAAGSRVTGAAPEPMDAAALEDMHLRKTGALIRAASTMGAIVLGADDAVVDAVDAYARNVGLAFQIIDDVLDVESSNDALGKTAGKDANAGKPTFPALYGVAGSRRLAADCIERARAALAAERLTGGRLGEMAEWSLKRER